MIAGVRKELLTVKNYHSEKQTKSKIEELRRKEIL